MGRALFVAALLVLSVSVRADLREADAAAIRNLDRAYVEAWLANDRSRVVALFADDAVIVPQNRAPIEGMDAVAKFWWPAGGKTTITSFQNTIAEVGGSHDLAFSRGSYDFAFDYESGGSVQSLRNRGNYLMLYRRENGAWRITHRMWADLPRR
jgi:uncharacterized protein (TIGR02246 family)